MRNLKSASPRTQLYMRLLTRKSGATAQELEQAVIAAKFVKMDKKAGRVPYTRHNSYSLGLLTERFGFDCYFERDAHGTMRYQAVPHGTPASKLTAWTPIVRKARNASKES